MVLQPFKWTNWMSSLSVQNRSIIRTFSQRDPYDQSVTTSRLAKSYCLHANMTCLSVYSSHGFWWRETCQLKATHDFRATLQVKTKQRERKRAWIQTSSSCVSRIHPKIERHTYLRLRCVCHLDTEKMVPLPVEIIWDSLWSDTEVWRK